MNKQYDLLKVVRFVAIFLIIVLTISISICTVAISSITKETSKYAGSVIITYVRETQQLLKNIDNSMVSEVMYDSNLDIIQKDKGDSEYVYAVRSTKNMLISLAHSYTVPANYMIYFPLTEETIDGSESEKEYNNWRSIKNDILKIATQNLAVNEYSKSGDWNIVVIGDEGYMIKYYKYNGRYICSWININELINTMVMNGLGDQCYFVFSNQTGAAYNNTNLLETDEINLEDYVKEGASSAKISATNLLISEPVKGTSFYLNAIIKNYSEVANILRLQIILIFAVGMVTIFCLVLVLYLRNKVIKPIQNFSDNIKRIRTENNYSVETHYQINELKNVSELLSDLVNQINGLKIDIYEKTLEKQKIKLDFYSEQIKPHFFINCLNIIYHMIQVGKYQETQYLIQCISDYVRYILKNDESMVKLGEEVEHIKKYIEIQKIRYRDAFQVDIIVEDEVLMVEIPPLIIQTFIENAMKYTIDWDEEILITLTAKKTSQNGDSYLVIIIEDSGEGFEVEILYKLQNQINISAEGKRIGIMNAVERLKLQYQEKADISFYNCEKGGAGIKIMIPIFTEEL